MDITNPNIGFATPLCYIASVKKASEACIAGIIEHHGIITGVYFNGAEWETTNVSETNVDAYFNQKQVTETTNAEIRTEVETEVETQFNEYTQAAFEHTPPGYFTKVALRHIPLSEENAEYVTKNEFVEDVYAMQSVESETGRGEVYVGIIVIERTHTSRVNHVFLYYDPSIKTWRIHDSTNGKEPERVVDTIYNEVQREVNSLYDSPAPPSDGEEPPVDGCGSDVSVDVHPSSQ